MKNRFTITESEKERILSLHEQASLTPNDILTNLSAMGTKDPNIAPFVAKANELITTTKIFGESPDLSKLTVDGVIKALQPYVTTDQQTVELIKKVLNSLKPELKLPITPVASPPVVASAPVQLGVKNQKIVKIQELLNDKYQSGLIVDGKWGPKTAAAIKAAFDKKGLTKVEAPKVEPPKADTSKAEVTATGGEAKPGAEVAASGGGETVAKNPKEL